jgi:hypothetical protein
MIRQATAWPGVPAIKYHTRILPRPEIRRAPPQQYQQDQYLEWILLVPFLIHWHWIWTR